MGRALITALFDDHVEGFLIGGDAAESLLQALSDCPEAALAFDDLSSAVQIFRNPHRDTPDTRRWRQALAPELEQLPRWLDLLS